MTSKMIFFKLMNNSVFIKTMRNVRKHRGIKLMTTEVRENYFVSEPNKDIAEDFETWMFDV